MKNRQSVQILLFFLIPFQDAQAVMKIQEFYIELNIILYFFQAEVELLELEWYLELHPKPSLMHSGTPSNSKTQV